MIETFDLKETQISIIVNALSSNINMFSFTVRFEMGASSQMQNLINDLSIFLVDKIIINEWPGTKLLSGTAQLYKYYLNKESIFLLIYNSDYLFDWISPHLPEDIIFYNGDLPVCISITHEKDVYLEINDNNKIDVLNSEVIKLLKNN